MPSYTDTNVCLELEDVANLAHCAWLREIVEQEGIESESDADR